MAPDFDLENGDLNRKFCNEVQFHNQAKFKSYISYNQYLGEKKRLSGIFGAVSTVLYGLLFIHFVILCQISGKIA